MTAADVWLLLLCSSGLLVALGATSGMVNETLWVSEPLACAIAGVALGPVGFGLLRLNPMTSQMDVAILLEAARMTLAIAVTVAAMRLPANWLRSSWRGLAVALGPGMLLMWGAGAAVSAVTLGLPTMSCLLVAAAIAPTDPVLSAPLLTGHLARRAVPKALRDAMTAESGINDGLALPLVMLPILLLAHSPAEAVSDWLIHVIVWELGSAVLIGSVAGWVTSRCMNWARRRPDADGPSLLTVTIALALATTAGVRLLGGDEILAAFVAGAVLNGSYRKVKVAMHHERFSEALGRFFDLPIMIVFGAAIPWAAWSSLGWGAIGFAVGILLLRRIPAWLLLGQFMPGTHSTSGALFSDWFGPIYAAALFYAMLIQEQTGSGALWPMISLAVAASVLAHGITGTPVTRMLENFTKPSIAQGAATDAVSIPAGVPLLGEGDS